MWRDPSRALFREITQEHELRASLEGGTKHPQTALSPDRGPGITGLLQRYYKCNQSFTSLAGGG